MYWLLLAGALLVPLLVALFFAGYLFLGIKSASDAQFNGPTTSSAPPLPPTVLSGLGATKTRPFPLDGGRYRVHFRFDDACHYTARLGSEGFLSREFERGPVRSGA